jgi:cobalt ECF transporter T component CbiQ
MKNKIPEFLLAHPSSASFKGGRGRLKLSFIEKGVDHLAQIIKDGYIQWETSSKDSIFHRIDARIKVLFVLFFIVIVSLKRDLLPEVYLAGFIFLLSLISRLDLVRFYRKVFFLGFIFGFLIALPSAFNVITKGEVIFPLFHFSKPHHFWVYEIPKEVGLTREGLSGVLMLTSRVINSVSLSLLLLYTTPFPDIIKALKVLRVPDSFLLIITLCHKYIFIFVKTVEDMHLAKKSRLVAPVKNAEARKWITGRIAFIFQKTRLRCEEIYRAMLSRGFSEDIKFYEPGKLTSLDFASMGALFLIGIFFLLM